jgi:hypothetical protein
VGGLVGWRDGTGWGKVYAYQGGTWGPSNSYYMGDTWSKFGNAIFCPTPAPVWTIYYYNRVWGFPDGHATRAQSSDSQNECLPFHTNIETAYGNYPG